MKPLVIYLIRHGESEGNIDQSVFKDTPDWRVGLTETGQRQSEATALILYKEVMELRERLGMSGVRPGAAPVKMYCSPFYRARQTAQILNNYWGVVPYEDIRIREQGWGNLAEDHLIMKIARERVKYGTFFYQVPNGESGAAVYDRVTPFIEMMHRDFERDDYPQVSIVVSHGLAILALLTSWFHWTPEDFQVCKTPKNCEIIKIVLNTETQEYELATPLRKRIN